MGSAEPFPPTMPSMRTVSKSRTDVIEKGKREKEKRIDSFIEMFLGAMSAGHAAF